MLSVIAEGFFRQSPLLWFPVLALLVFIILFTVVSFRTLRREKVDLDRAARLPLEDSDHE